MKRIGYIRETFRLREKDQREVIEPHDCAYIVVDGKHESVAEAIQLLRHPGDQFVVHSFYVVSNAREERERIARQIFGKGGVIYQASTDWLVSDLESFLVGLRSAKREGLPKEHYQRAQQRGRGRAMDLKKRMTIIDALKLDPDRDLRKLAKKYKVSLSTVYRLLTEAGIERDVRPGRKPATQ